MAELKILKLSVMSAGNLLLDGRESTLAEFRQALRALVEAKGTLWYYRENAAGEAPRLALEVLNLITASRLPVRLSTRPDFSDTVTPNPMEQIFALARLKARERNIVILRPDGKHNLLPVASARKAPAEAVAGVERILPSNVKRNVAVIGETGWTMETAPSLHMANEAIPFFGMLMGFGAIGHAVWIFQPAGAESLTYGARNADVLIADSALVDGLPGGWREVALKSMRGREVLIHDRATFSLRRA